MRRMLTAVAVALGIWSVASAQPAPQPSMIAAQTAAMARLAWMDGVWRGPATTVGPSGARSITQTERIGPMLGGSVKVLEGRGYNADGSTGFNAFGVISYDPATSAYTLRSHAQGYAGSFPLTPTADGYVWEIPAGPAMSIRYTATLKNGTWREVGDRVMTGKPPVRMFEMTLKRVGDTTWPLGTPVAAK